MRDTLKPPGPDISIQKVESNNSAYTDEDEDKDLLDIFNNDETESVLSIESMNMMELKATNRNYNKIMDLLRETEDTARIRRFDIWLLAEVLLQGTVYLTDKYLLFSTQIPYADSRFIQAGALSKKSAPLLPAVGKTVFKRYWVVLKRSCFSWFRSAKDIYFPVGVIKISQINSCAVKDDNKFEITTENQTFIFRADSPNSALNWVKSLKREIFISKNQGNDNSVVRIPLNNITGYFFSQAMEIVCILNLEVKTTDSHHKQYCFAFFEDKLSLKRLTKELQENGVPISRHTPDKDANVTVNEDVLDTIISEAPFSMPVEIPKEGSDHWTILPSSPVNWNSLNLLGMLNSRLRKPKNDKFFTQDISSLANAAVAPLKVLPLLNLSGKDSQKESNNNNNNNEHKRNSSSTSADLSYNDDISDEDLESESEYEDDDPDGADLSSFLTNPKLTNLDECNEVFRNHFGLESGTKIISEFSCNLKKPNATISWGGTLVVSNNYLCFQRRNIRGSNWRMVVPLSDIVHVHPGSEDSGSVSLEFEVTDSSYGIFKIIFNNRDHRKDAELKIKSAIDKKNSRPGSEKASKKRLADLNEASESRFLEYAILSARTSASTPNMSSRFANLIPPLVFDRKSKALKLETLEKPFKSMKFAMMMIGSRGDVQPYIALSQGLMEEGHTCVIITHKEFQPWVESFGIEFREVGDDPGKLMELMVCYGSISYSFMRDALSNFKQWIKKLMHDSWHALRDLEADVLIESPSSMIGIHIAESLNIPYFRAFTMPWTRTKTYPQALIQPDSRYSGNYNYLTYVMYDHMVWFGISKMVNHWRKHHLKLPPTDLDLMEQDEIPFLYCVSPTVLVPPLDQPDWVHTCGYWELKENEKEKEKEKNEIDPKLEAFIKKSKDSNKPIIYVGFGSIIVSDPDAMTNTVVDAVKDAGVNCVLARGWSSRSSKMKEKESKKDKKKGKDHKDPDKKPIDADHIFEVDSVSHQWLFPQMDVCVHHGGSGTTGTSLRYGRPTIIKPFFGDQYFYARRVEDLNVGVHLKRLTKSGLVSAIRTCIDDKKLIRQAHTVGEQISHEHGVSAGILYLYQELSYAKEVTEHRRKQTLDAVNNGHFGPIPFKSYTNKISPFSGIKAPKISSILPSLPKFGKREEQVRAKSEGGEIDVSV